MSEKPSMLEPDPTVSVAVVYDSGSRGYPVLSGRTRVLAEAVAAGAGGESTLVTLIPVADRASYWEALDAADAAVFGCPTYMGSGSAAALKAFTEETIQPQFLEQQWKDKLAAGFTNSAGMSGDKLLTLQQLAGFAAQHGMIWITLGQVPGWQTSVGSAHDPNRLASFSWGSWRRATPIRAPTWRLRPARPGDGRAIRPADKRGGSPLGSRS